MHITCEHCGSTIDLDKDKVCPNCGAPYNNNKEFKSVKEYHKKNKEMNLKEREMMLENQKEVHEAAKKVATGVFAGSTISFIITAIFGVFFIAMIGLAIYSFNEKKDYLSPSETINDESAEEVKEDVVVGFNELAQTNDFEIKCDRITNYKLVDYEKDNLKNTGLVVYNFQVLFTSKTDDWTYPSNIKLVYTDKAGNENISAKAHDTFFNHQEDANQIEDSFHDTLSHKGNLAFELPKEANNVKLVYKNVTIKIDNFKSLIK